MRSNLSDLSKKVSHTVSIGKKKPVWFIRDKLYSWYGLQIQEWKTFCEENDIEQIDEVLIEITKLHEAIKNEKSINQKTVDWKLILGYDNPNLDDLANEWLDLYLDHEMEK
ncbi:hypothetical protein ZPAH1_orf00191 [Aeromonas phage ZPAH1]|nr:hypothetical protein ZPAH1_orf00191 [Aeromonas phage ZPAH1]